MSPRARAGGVNPGYHAAQARFYRPGSGLAHRQQRGMWVQDVLHTVFFAATMAVIMIGPEVLFRVG